MTAPEARALLHEAGAHYAPYDGFRANEQRRGWYLAGMWLGKNAVEGAIKVSETVVDMPKIKPQGTF